MVAWTVPVGHTNNMETKLDLRHNGIWPCHNLGSDRLLSDAGCQADAALIAGGRRASLQERLPRVQGGAIE